MKRFLALPLVVLAGGALFPLDSATATPTDCARYQDQLRLAAWLPRDLPETGVAVNGSARRAYVCGSTRILGVDRTDIDVLDVRHADQPELIGSLSLPVVLSKLAYAEDHLFLVGHDNTDDPALANGRFAVVDVSDPTAPAFVTQIDLPGFPKRVTVKQDRAYVTWINQLADGRWISGGLAILDVHDPSAPVILTTGDIAEVPAGVRVRGNLAYLTAGSADGGRLIILDVQDPAAPVRLTSYPVYGDDVVLDGNLAYCVSSTFSVVDVSDPTAPVTLGSTQEPIYVTGAALSDETVIASWYNGLATFDVSDPTHPTLVGKYTTLQQWLGVALQGARAFVPARDLAGGGLQVIDVSTPSQVQPISSFDLTGLPVTGGQSSDYVVLTRPHDMAVLDVSDPTAPALLSAVASRDIAVAVKERDGIAYLADGWGGLRLFDLADPANPVPLGEIALNGYCARLALEDGWAYVSSPQSGVYIVDVSDPTSPHWVSMVPMAYPSDIEVSDHLVLVYDATPGKEGITAIDVKDPTAPVQVAKAPGTVKSIALKPPYVYAAAGDLLVYDISDPVTLNLVRTVSPGTFISSFKIAGDVGYSTSSPFASGFNVFDLRHPSDPVLLGNSANGRTVQVRGDLVFASDVGMTWIYPAQCAGGDIPPPTRQVAALDQAGSALGGREPTLAIAVESPFSGASTLRLDLPVAAAASVTVHDVTGRRVRTLAERRLPAGETALTWDGRNDNGARVADGVYFVTARTADARKTVRVVRLSR